MIPKYNTALDVVLSAIEQRKLNFDRDEFKGLLLERVCQELECDDKPKTQENITTKMVRYATDFLMVLDDIYFVYDKDLWLDKDASGCYWITDYPPKRTNDCK